MGGFDTDWASFSETIERLMTFVRNKDGIETVIKNLDGKLSEAIMHAMTNGPDLEKKVSHAENILFYYRRRVCVLSLPSYASVLSLNLGWMSLNAERGESLIPHLMSPRELILMNK
jgi:hypothetical protein